MRGDAHVRFGGRAEETVVLQGRHWASADPYQWMLGNGYAYLREPILRPLHAIETKNALIDWTDPEHPREAEWPDAKFIIGDTASTARSAGPPRPNGSTAPRPPDRGFEHIPDLAGVAELLTDLMAAA